MQAVIGAGADIVCVETMSDINEARLAIQAARSVSASIPVMATMTFEATPRGFFTIMGVSIERACRELQEAGADLVGSNCGNGSLQMVAIAREFKKFSKLPLVIQANAGVPGVAPGAGALSRDSGIHGRRWPGNAGGRGGGDRRLLRHHPRPHPGHAPGPGRGVKKRTWPFTGLKTFSTRSASP